MDAGLWLSRQVLAFIESDEHLSETSLLVRAAPQAAEWSPAF
jgi:hypothetical protein